MTLPSTLDNWKLLGNTYAESDFIGSAKSTVYVHVNCLPGFPTLCDKQLS